jgi:predicted amidophosphoribosyltransferase
VDHPRHVALNGYYRWRDDAHHSDPFSLAMDELKDHPTRGRARRFVQEKIAAVRDFLDTHQELVAGRRVVVVSVPGASGQYSASDALADEVAHALRAERQELVGRVSTRQGRNRQGEPELRRFGSQKSKHDLLERIRNAGGAYDVESVGDEVVLLVDDIETSGASTDVTRALLQPADVLTITFGRTVRD